MRPLSPSPRPLPSKPSGVCLDHGVDINVFNNNGQTALHRASKRGADQIVRFLAEHGAKLDMKDKLNRTPVDVAGAAHETTAALIREYAAAK